VQIPKIRRIYLLFISAARFGVSGKTCTKFTAHNSGRRFRSFPSDGRRKAVFLVGRHDGQMYFLRSLLESRPYFSRIPDQSLIVGDAGKGGLHLQATRDSAGSYALIYFPLNG
jgi:hypothetical protein